MGSVAAGGRCGVSVAAGGWGGGPHISTDEDTQRRDNGSHLASSFFLIKSEPPDHVLYHL